MKKVAFTDEEKFQWLVQSNQNSVFPDGFYRDSELTLIAMLAQRIDVLEKKVNNQNAVIG